MSTFRRTIQEVINCHCKEGESNTPDFILANYLCNCLDAFTLATKNRDKWYSVHLEPTSTNTGIPKHSPCGECGSEESESIKKANGDFYCRRCGRKLRES